MGHEKILFLSCVPDRCACHAVSTLKRLGEIKLIEATRGFAIEEPRGPDCCKIAISLKTTRESAVAGYRGLLWPFKIRRMAAIVFQFRVVAGAP